jgi:hypothetical protein
MKSDQIKEITDRAAEQLVVALQAGHSEALTTYLKAIARFHRYSLHNVLLIASQKPNASYVAGFRTWNELGRFVRKGEKGIMILAPVVRRRTDDQEEREEPSCTIAGFRAAYVFDISQTDGKELPQIGLVEGDPREYGDKLDGPVSLFRMGSAENWVGYHVLAHLALHKWFRQKKRPVPAFIIFDQPSQAHYPPDRDAEGSLDVLGDEDQTAVLQLFKLIADAAAELSPHLQIIIMDHADLKQDWFQTSVVERWRSGQKLVPVSWID